MYIRPAQTSDLNPLMHIWLDSARATHTFLSESDIAELVPAVRDYLTSANSQLWVLCNDKSEPIGFMGLADNNVDSLFLSVEYLRRGGGRMLLVHARKLKGRLQVDVNEQNPEAVFFYESNGFQVVRRSAVDSAGRPFPLLHMRETAQ